MSEGGRQKWCHIMSQYQDAHLTIRHHYRQLAKFKIKSSGGVTLLGVGLVSAAREREDHQLAYSSSSSSASYLIIMGNFCLTNMS